MTAKEIYDKAIIQRNKAIWLDIYLTLSLETAVPLLPLLGLQIESTPQLRLLCHAYPDPYYDHSKGQVKAVTGILDQIAHQLDEKLAYEIFLWAIDASKVSQHQRIMGDWAQLFHELLRDTEASAKFLNRLPDSKINTLQAVLQQYQLQRLMITALFDRHSFLMLELHDEVNKLWVRLTNTYSAVSPDTWMALQAKTIHHLCAWHQIRALLDEPEFRFFIQWGRAVGKIADLGSLKLPGTLKIERYSKRNLMFLE